MEILIWLFATFGLSFLLTQMDGPFGIIAKCRNIIVQFPYIGLFFYKLIQCGYCNGFWLGTIIYIFINCGELQFNLLICCGLAAAGFNLILFSLYNKYLS